MERDTREAVDPEYHYMIFDIVSDSYLEHKISFDKMLRLYFQMSGVEPIEPIPDVV